MVDKVVTYSNGFKNNIIGDVDQSIESRIISNLDSDQVFINTTWLEVNNNLRKTFDKNKTAVCYSGPDWENTSCINIRKDAHILIKENFKDVIHIGNSQGKFYFNYWLEFIRQNPTDFFNSDYLKDPSFKKLYMCLNRKPHAHRIFLIDLFEENNLLSNGHVSIFRKNNPKFLKENLSKNIKLANNSVVDSNPINNDILSLGDADLWNSYFINIVTETTVHTNVFISEKTWKPIIGLRPFLILGDYQIYNQLKLLGFDTFDDLFGTWYKDNNWENRAKSIVDIIKYYKKENINFLYNTIKSRLIQNRIQFFSIMEENFKKINYATYS